MSRKTHQSVAVILKQFESPDETRVLVKGKFEIVRLRGMTIGRATYEPGWKWSEHVAQRLAKHVARLNTSEWLCQVRQRPLSMTVRSSK
jgi:hypothetical protein